MTIQTTENHSTVSAGIEVMVPFEMASPPSAAELSNFRSLLGRLVSISRVTWLKLDVSRGYSVSLLVFYTYWSIIDKADLHHRLEYTVLDLVCCIEILHFGEEIVIQLFCLVRFGCTMKIGFIALSRIGEKSELGYCQRVTLDGYVKNISGSPQSTSPSISCTFCFHCCVNQSSLDLLFNQV